MAVIGLICFLIVPSVVFGLGLNTTCPNVTPETIDIQALDGLWFVSEAATDLPIVGNCTKIVFNHIGNSNGKSTEVSLQWIKNNSLVEYNGTASITPDGSGDYLSINFTDKYVINYSLLSVSYEHYALLYSCSNNADGNSSSYELWKLSRSTKLKEKHAAEMDNVLANYNISRDALKTYTNTKAACFTNAGYYFQEGLPMALMGSAIITIYRHALP